jgi:hypothetical protein
MSLKIVKRGRPSKADIAARQAAVAHKRVKSDSQILTDLKDRFDLLSRLTKGSVAEIIRAMVVTGAPGVGKTYTVEQILEREAKDKHEIVRGTLSAINLYMLAWQYRHPGNVIVLDDADDIFHDEDALNILKVLCDTSATRTVSYRKEAHQLKEQDIPQSFEFRGTMIFISNVDFQRFVDEGKNKFAAHMGALMSRSLYLDLQIHDRNSLGVWVSHIAQTGRIFDRENVPMALRKPILDFLKVHREDLRELSIRTLMKVCSLAKSNPTTWQKDARVLLTRSN